MLHSQDCTFFRVRPQRSGTMETLHWMYSRNSSNLWLHWDDNTREWMQSSGKTGTLMAGYMTGGWRSFSPGKSLILSRVTGVFLLRWVRNMSSRVGSGDCIPKPLLGWDLLSPESCPNASPHVRSVCLRIPKWSVHTHCTRGDNSGVSKP